MLTEFFSHVTFFSCVMHAGRLSIYIIVVVTSVKSTLVYNVACDSKCYLLSHAAV